MVSLALPWGMTTGYMVIFRVFRLGVPQWLSERKKRNASDLFSHAGKSWVIAV